MQVRLDLQQMKMEKDEVQVLLKTHIEEQKSRDNKMMESLKMQQREELKDLRKGLENEFKDLPKDLVNEVVAGVAAAITNPGSDSRPNSKQSTESNQLTGDVFLYNSSLLPMLSSKMDLSSKRDIESSSDFTSFTVDKERGVEVLHMKIDIDAKNHEKEKEPIYREKNGEIEKLKSENVNLKEEMGSITEKIKQLDLANSRKDRD
ncbi:unnamed protein product [Mytilus coruscus]|uniref:Uncharacterized protein n=1 Tax=Mytilus coruscus TaxID=42192 RepID=A0A6J8CS44_MYTCO|nr:unnamed protein product [Mytilus coruscus]